MTTTAHSRPVASSTVDCSFCKLGAAVLGPARFSLLGADSSSLLVATASPALLHGDSFPTVLGVASLPSPPNQAQIAPTTQAKKAIVTRTPEMISRVSLF